MSRSSWKPTYIHPKAISYNENLNVQQNILSFAKKEKEIYFLNRSTQITKQMVGLKTYIWTGNRFISLNITQDMLGLKLGEFAPTRKKPKHKVKKKIKK